MGFLHEHIILPLSDLITGQQVHRYLRLLREAEQWDADRMQRFQLERLQRLVAYVVEEVPFYSKWFADHHLHPSDIRTMNDFRRLPVVDKKLMRKEGLAAFSAEHFPQKSRMVSRSGGSTGEPFTFYESKLSYSVNMAAKLRTWYEAGYRLGNRYVKITNGVRSSRIKKLQDGINRCLYLPFYSINEEVLTDLLKEIENSQPEYIRSYPAPLYLLAKYRNQHPGSYRFSPRHIFTTGSTLPDEYRKEIERAFGCDVIDSYSCEGTPNTFETPAHDGYHVSDYYGMIEVLDNEGHPVTNGVGRVVSTDFWNFAYPFIRYDTQDLVEVCNGLIVRITGRACETLLEVNGNLLTVHNFTHYFADNYPSVDGWQVLKRKNGEVEFRLVVNYLFGIRESQEITDYWSARMGCPVFVSVVAELPLMNNNKHLSIIQES